jgi:hypothetical protein
LRARRRRRRRSKYEFDYAYQTLGTGMMIPIVMEPACLDKRAWSGVVLGKLGPKRYVDLSANSGTQSWRDGIEDLKVMLAAHIPGLAKKITIDPAAARRSSALSQPGSDGVMFARLKRMLVIDAVVHEDEEQQSETMQGDMSQLLEFPLSHTSASQKLESLSVEQVRSLLERLGCAPAGAAAHAKEIDGERLATLTDGEFRTVLGVAEPAVRAKLLNDVAELKALQVRAGALRPHGMRVDQVRRWGDLVNTLYAASEHGPLLSEDDAMSALKVIGERLHLRPTHEVAQALPAIIAAMDGHPNADELHELAARVLAAATADEGKAEFACSSAIKAGAIAVLARSMRNFVGRPAVVRATIAALTNLSSSDSGGERAVDHGAMSTVIDVMRTDAHRHDLALQAAGCRAITVICDGERYSAAQRDLRADDDEKEKRHAAAVRRRKRAIDRFALPAIASALDEANADGRVSREPKAELAIAAVHAIIALTLGEGDVAEGNWQEVVGHDGLLRRLPEAMAAHKDVLQVQIYCFDAVINIAKGEGAHAGARRQAAVEAGILPAVLDAISAHATDLALLERALSVITAVTTATGTNTDEYRRVAASSSGLIGPIVKAMKEYKDSPKLFEAAATALHSITAGESEERCNAVKEADALAALAAGMKENRKMASIIVAACSAIVNLVSGDDPMTDVGESNGPNSRRWLAVQANVHKAVVDGMAAHVDQPTVQEMACRAIRNLARTGGQVGAEVKFATGVQARACEHIALALGTHRGNLPLVEWAERALINLTYPTSDQVNMCRQSAAETGCLAKLKIGMSAHPLIARVQEYGCQAIANITGGPPEKPRSGAVERYLMALDQDVLADIVDALNRHAADPKVVQWASVALFNLAKGSGQAGEMARTTIVGAGALHALVAAIQTTPGASEAIEHACRALAKIAAGEGAAAKARRREAIEAHALLALAAVFGALTPLARATPPNSGSQDRTHELLEICCIAIIAIVGGADGGEQAKEAACKAGLLGALVDVVNDNPNLPMVAEKALRAIADITAGEGSAHDGRADDAVQQGALSVIDTAMSADTGVEELQLHACRAIAHLTSGMGAGARARKEQAAANNAIGNIVAALRHHRQSAAVQEAGMLALHAVANGAKAVKRDLDARAAVEQAHKVFPKQVDDDMAAVLIKLFS